MASQYNDIKFDIKGKIGIIKVHCYEAIYLMHMNTDVASCTV